MRSIIIALIMLFTMPCWGEELEIQWTQDMTIQVDRWELYMTELPGNYDYTNPLLTIQYDGNPQDQYTTDTEIQVPANSETTKYFVLRAINIRGPSPNSNEASITIDNRVPAQPFILRIRIVEDG